MRAVTRLFAAVKPSQFLEPGAPTGLCGLLTHPSPRSTLLYLYSSTLDKLKQLPESSVYRQSTEALTKHRLSIIQSIKPEGWDKWEAKINVHVSDFPDDFKTIQTSGGTMIDVPNNEEVDLRAIKYEWGGEVESANLEGPRSMRERRGQAARTSGAHKQYNPEKVHRDIKLEPEPPLTAEQVSDLEAKIGAGLIEEVIQVAEGEHKLVDEMAKSRVWEELVEKAPEGQWSYFERGTHAST
ncbi:uncharacterized protein BDR25DRAFT_300705 [Lindgomyces ingoldianus]|uniref:Uncharacterized protein n=1 Tax=Lindgomyces ingoldianus TaxID=673940 RepID=A0ACB6R9G8_9PLEO|nr:uncharacterized protein BDR25DRAFT_300705 [Lindgomyces ingoldianus]KAF2475695.1 hypothetical protein BDR25DRAFT_300705 [Lindgomyces ingoldianus]